MKRKQDRAVFDFPSQMDGKRDEKSQAMLIISTHNAEFGRSHMWLVYAAEKIAYAENMEFK